MRSPAEVWPPLNKDCQPSNPGPRANPGGHATVVRTPSQGRSSAAARRSMGISEPRASASGHRLPLADARGSEKSAVRSYGTAPAAVHPVEGARVAMYHKVRLHIDQPTGGELPIGGGPCST